MEYSAAEYATLVYLVLIAVPKYTIANVKIHAFQNFLLLFLSRYR